MTSTTPPTPFQNRVGAWVSDTFGAPATADINERGDRLLEEVLELLQAHGYDRSQIGRMADYVYGREAGVPAQEVGGVMVTLAAYCHAIGIDMQQAGERELARIEDPDIAASVRAKRKSKPNLRPDIHLGRDADIEGSRFPPTFRPASLGTRVRLRHAA